MATPSPKSHFSVAFWRMFSQIQGICDRIFLLQKSVTAFGDFSQKKKSLTPCCNELFKYEAKSQLGSITLRMSSMDCMRITSELHGIGNSSCPCSYVCVGSATLHAFISFNLIYKSKCGVCLSVYGDKQGRAGQGRAGRPGQPLRGPGEVPFLLKKSLGKTEGPANNQTKIQFFLKIIFIIEHIKKLESF